VVYNGISGVSGREARLDDRSGILSRQLDLGMATLEAYDYANAQVLRFPTMGIPVNDFKRQVENLFSAANLQRPCMAKQQLPILNVDKSGKSFWYCRGMSSNIGIGFSKPVLSENEPFRMLDGLVARAPENLKPLLTDALSITPLLPSITEEIYNSLRNIALNDPFRPGQLARPMTKEWYCSYLFYLEIFKRGGLSFSHLDAQNFVVGNAGQTRLDTLEYKDLGDGEEADLSEQVLGLYGASGSVNHPLHMLPLISQIDNAVQAAMPLPDLYRAGTFWGMRLFMTYELVLPLTALYEDGHGNHIMGVDLLLKLVVSLTEAEIGAMFDGGAVTVNSSDLAFSVELTRELLSFCDKALDKYQVFETGIERLTRLGISTIPMFLTSMSHLYHQRNHRDTVVNSSLKRLSDDSYGHLNLSMLQFIDTHRQGLVNDIPHPWFFEKRYNDAARNTIGSTRSLLQSIFYLLKGRICDDPVGNSYTSKLDPARVPITETFGAYQLERSNIAGVRRNALLPENRVTRMYSARVAPSANLNYYFAGSPPVPSFDTQIRQKDVDRLQDVELVIVRPNIEHNMLGVIMGLGGDSLGNTLWGQTELSVYDDSMHGIWGMSYKYHERAIVFNEKNLIRMWDIAYDGYNGGKDDTYVDWTDEDGVMPNGYNRFKELTLDLSKNYRGPSMMVMAFVHDRHKTDDRRENLFDKHFKRNWPSPVVFYDSYQPGQAQGREALPIDYDNLQTVDMEGFRVFNNMLYYNAYSQYKRLMPEFKTMHITRKNAGQSSADSETATDCLAFQGSMRIKENGTLLQTIDGSGHHGPDYTGVASVRAGKGQKTAGVAPTLHRLI
jgi:hypothetical protein